MAENDTEDVPVACRLTESEKDRRREDWVAETFAEAFRDAEEREDGYEFVFDGSDEMLEAVTTFLQRETDCCPFARFTLEVTPGLEAVRLLFAGPEGTKDLLEAGLFDEEFLGPSAA